MNLECMMSIDAVLVGFFFFFFQNQILISLNSALSEMIKILQHNWTTDLSYGILVTKV